MSNASQGTNFVSASWVQGAWHDGVHSIDAVQGRVHAGSSAACNFPARTLHLAFWLYKFPHFLVCSHAPLPALLHHTFPLHPITQFLFHTYLYELKKRPVLREEEIRSQHVGRKLKPKNGDSWRSGSFPCVHMHMRSYASPMKNALSCICSVFVHPGIIVRSRETTCFFLIQKRTVTLGVQVKCKFFLGQS